MACKRRRVEQELVGATRVAEGGGCAAAEGSWEGHGGGHPPPPLSPTGRLCAVGWGGEGGGQPPVNTVDVPLEDLAPPPPHTHALGPLDALAPA